MENNNNEDHLTNSSASVKVLRNESSTAFTNCKFFATWYTRVKLKKK